jgi:hypothetical protein
MSELDHFLWLYDRNGDSGNAAAELAALRARDAELEAQNAQLQAVIALNKYVTPPFDIVDDDTARLALECVDKDKRIVELEAAVRDTQTQLRATQRNWTEDCLYRADDILTKALAAQPAPEAVTP